MAARNLRRLDPTHWVYLLVHALVFILGVILVRACDGLIATSIGTSLIAGGITGWTVFIYVFLSRDTSDRLRVLTQFGLTTIFEARSVRIKQEYDRRLAAVADRIDVMGFGLRALREDYLDGFASWSQRATVRILLIDPNFPVPEHNLARIRDAEEQQAADLISADVQRFVDATALLRRNEPTRFQVRYYTCLPSINIFRLDDDLFWGPYFVKEQSRNCPTLLVRRGGLLFDRISKHFEQIWSDSALSRSVDEPSQ